MLHLFAFLLHSDFACMFLAIEFCICLAFCFCLRCFCIASLHFFCILISLACFSQLGRVFFCVLFLLACFLCLGGSLLLHSDSACMFHAIGFCFAFILRVLAVVDCTTCYVLRVFLHSLLQTPQSACKTNASQNPIASENKQMQTGNAKINARNNAKQMNTGNANDDRDHTK